MGFDVSGGRGETLTSRHSKLQTFLPEILHYISSVEGLCCTGKEPIKTNIGFRVVGGSGQLLHDFNFESYSEAVVRKVMTLTLPEETRFNRALLKSFQEKFEAQSRAGVKVRVSRTRPPDSSAGRPACAEGQSL